MPRQQAVLEILGASGIKVEQSAAVNGQVAMDPVHVVVLGQALQFWIARQVERPIDRAFSGSRGRTFASLMPPMSSKPHSRIPPVNTGCSPVTARERIGLVLVPESSRDSVKVWRTG
jgi:hypothetical protein